MTTPSKQYLEYGSLKEKPFHRETWFVVALAATSIVIIITIVAVLCVQSKTYKYKGRQSCGTQFVGLGVTFIDVTKIRA